MSKVNIEFPPVEIKNFGSLVLNDGFAENMEDAEFTELVNFDITDGRTLKKRNGFKHYISLPGTTDKAYIFSGPHLSESWARNAIYVCAVNGLQGGAAGAKFYGTADGGTSWYEYTSLADRLVLPGIQYNDTYYFPSQSSATPGLISTSGDTGAYAGVANTPSCSTITQVLDRGFLNSLDTEGRTLVYYSNPGDLNGWATNQFVEINKDDGEAVVVLVGYKDRLVVFKENSIWVLYLTGSPVNWSLRKYIAGVGATSPLAVQLVDDYIYFTARDGIYRTNLSTMEDISAPLKSVFNSRQTPLMDQAYLHPILIYGFNDAMGYWNGRLICQIGTTSDFIGTVPTRTFVYYNRVESWAEWKPQISPVINYMPISRTVRDGNVILFQPGLYTGSRNRIGNSWRFSDDPARSSGFFDDDTLSYDASFTSKEFTLDSSYEWKKIPYMSLSYGGDNDLQTTYQFTVDGESRPAVQLPGFEISPTTVKSTKHKGPGYFRRLRVRYEFKNSNDQNGLEVRNFVLHPRMKALLTTVR